MFWNLHENYLITSVRMNMLLIIVTMQRFETSWGWAVPLHHCPTGSLLLTFKVAWRKVQYQLKPGVAQFSPNFFRDIWINRRLNLFIHFKILQNMCWTLSLFICWKSLKTNSIEYTLTLASPYSSEICLKNFLFLFMCQSHLRQTI